MARCVYKLLCSALFAEHADYIRKQILHCLLEVRDPPSRGAVKRLEGARLVTHAVQ